MSHSFRYQDDTPEELNDAQFSALRSEILTHLFGDYLPGEEGAAAILLNIYRLNFGGGNPDGFTAHLSTLPYTHFWHAEYARANLAWNVTRIRVYLRLRGGQAVTAGEKDAVVRILWGALLNMEKIEKRNLLTNDPLFPFEQPAALTMWYEDQPAFVKPGDAGSHLHQSAFYQELVLRDFVGRVWGQVRRAEKRRVEEVRKFIEEELDNYTDAELGELVEQGVGGPGRLSKPADHRFWTFEEVDEDEGEEGVEKKAGEDISIEGDGTKGRYGLRKRKTEEPLASAGKEKKRRK